MYFIYDTPKGEMVVLSRPKGGYEEYSLISCIEYDRKIRFMQIVGEVNPRPFFGDGYSVHAQKLDRRRELYTAYEKNSFSYRLPFNRTEVKIFIAPTEEAARDIFRKVVGIHEQDKLEKYFTTWTVRDGCRGSKRTALVARQVYDGRSARDEVIQEFLNEARTPAYFKGGAIGENNG